MPQLNESIARARALRHRMTEAERVLWAKLRNRGVAGAKFRRQVPIGQYVADFVCIEARLIIEVDGGQHADAEQADAERSRVLEAVGFRVVRFWNNEVLCDLEGVLTTITMSLRKTEAHPHPDPLPLAGEGDGSAAVASSPLPRAGEGGAREAGG